MILDKLQIFPQKSTSLATSLVSVGLFLVVLGAAFAHFGLQTQSPAWEDFARGLFFGMGMALELIGVILMAQSARRHRRA
jgi:ABC-type Mn2+/Zn2+ transport system permease subunit